MNTENILNEMGIDGISFHLHSLLANLDKYKTSKGTKDNWKATYDLIQHEYLQLHSKLSEVKNKKAAESNASKLKRLETEERSIKKKIKDFIVIDDIVDSKNKTIVFFTTRAKSTTVSTAFQFKGEVADKFRPGESVNSVSKWMDENEWVSIT